MGPPLGTGGREEKKKTVRTHKTTTTYVQRESDQIMDRLIRTRLWPSKTSHPLFVGFCLVLITASPRLKRNCGELWWRSAASPPTGTSRSTGESSWRVPYLACVCFFRCFLFWFLFFFVAALQYNALASVCARLGSVNFEYCSRAFFSYRAHNKLL